MGKIKNLLNYHLLPVSYKLWKEEQDKKYNQISQKLKLNWLSAQHNAFSSTYLPIFILLTTMGFGFFTITLNFIKTDILLKILSVISYLLAFLIIFGSILFIGLSSHHYERYIYEKYLELSKSPKK